MADNERAIGYATQTAFGTPNPPSAPAYGIREYSNPANVRSDTPHYLTNQAFNQVSIRILTRQGRYRIQGDVSVDNTSPLMESMFGPITTGVIKAGVGTRKFLTLKFAEGLTQYWQAQDCSVNTFEVTYTVADGLQFVAELVGPQAAVTATAWSTLAPVPTQLVPFSNWQVVIKKGSTFMCVRRFRLAGNNNMEPLYCSPQANPTTGTLAGLTPTRYVYGDGEIAIEHENRYTANAGSEYEAWSTQAAPASWTIECIAPGGTADLLFTMPRMGYTEGEIMRERVNWESMKGFALFDATLASPLSIAVTA